MKNGNKRIISFSLISFLFLFSFALAFGQERNLEIKYPEIFGFSPKTIETSLSEYVKYLFNFSVTIIGLILFGNLIWAGFLYLTSFGEPAKLKESKEKINSVFLGVILLLSSYIILTTINPELTIFKLPTLIKEKHEARQFQKYEPEQLTHIFWEIPLGQMVEKGLWEKDRTKKLNDLLEKFEKFLKDKKISNLNKKLKTLTESCHCENLTAICQKPNNFGQPVGCIGDPCGDKVREEINDILRKNELISKDLSSFKRELTKIKDSLEEEGRKFRHLIEIFENCKQKGLLTRTEYYESVAAIEEQGGITKLEKLYRSTEDDPLVFYCQAGGTIYDYPYNPEPFPYEEIENAEEFYATPIEAEPLSCPVVIPFGELAIEEASILSYGVNQSIEETIYYIDKTLSELTKMTELTQQCNKKNCKDNCGCIINPCYPICNIPPSLFFPNLCFRLCSPCLQTIGGCSGQPCPRQEINETTERIKIYEEEIFNLIDEIKVSIEDAQLILENKEGRIDLKKIRGATQDCLSLDAQTAPIEKPTEEPFWLLLSCEMALGNKGPDGNIITNCYPSNFYCCTNKPPAVSPFTSVSQEEKQPIYTQSPKEPYSSSNVGFNNVPYFSQLDPRWHGKQFGNCGPRRPTIGSSGCGPTSIAMALSFFGKKIDPPNMAKWVVAKGFRECRAGTSWGACCAAVKELGGGKLECKDFSRIGSRKRKAEAVLEELRNKGKKVAVVSGRGIPPYTRGGHYIVLTGIKKEAGEEFVYYNDPASNPNRPKRRPAQGKKPADFFLKSGIGAGCVISPKK